MIVVKKQTVNVKHKGSVTRNAVKRSSSGDEIANVNCFTTTSYTYYKVQ